MVDEGDTAMIPYANLLYLNTGQAIIAVFLFRVLKSDRSSIPGGVLRAPAK